MHIGCTTVRISIAKVTGPLNHHLKKEKLFDLGNP
jgi:hypothetical protein